MLRIGTSDRRSLQVARGRHRLEEDDDPGPPWQGRQGTLHASLSPPSGDPTLLLADLPPNGVALSGRDQDWPHLYRNGPPGLS